MADDANTPVDPYSDPIWSQAAVIPNTYRFDAIVAVQVTEPVLDETGNAVVDEGGNAVVQTVTVNKPVVFFVEAPTEDAARGLFMGHCADQNPTIALYQPTNEKLDEDWNAGGFTKLSVG